MMGETWKRVLGYESYLIVSDYGNIKILEREVKNGKGVRVVKERILMPRLSSDKYKYSMVDFTLNGVSHSLCVGRVVYETFHNMKLGLKLTVQNKDGNRQNNRLDNLAILTRRGIKHVRGNKTGRTGVNYVQEKDFYAASIVFEGRKLTLHTSNNKEECSKIYQLAKCMIDEYDKLKAGILNKSYLSNKLIEKEYNLKGIYNDI